MNTKKKHFKFLVLLLILSLTFIKMPTLSSSKPISKSGKSLWQESVIKAVPPTDNSTAAYKRFDINESIRFFPTNQYNCKIFTSPLNLLSISKVRQKPVFLLLDLRDLIIKKINSYFDGSKYKDIASFIA